MSCLFYAQKSSNEGGGRIGLNQRQKLFASEYKMCIRDRRETDFINCVIWRQQAENLANWAKKGALIGITGRIQMCIRDRC